MLVVLDQKVEERSKDIWKIDTQMDPLCVGGRLRQATSTQLMSNVKGLPTPGQDHTFPSLPSQIYTPLG